MGSGSMEDRRVAEGMVEEEDLEVCLQRRQWSEQGKKEMGKRSREQGQKAEGPTDNDGTGRSLVSRWSRQVDKGLASRRGRRGQAVEDRDF